MSNILRNRFIILCKTKYGESDLVIQGLSPQGAKLSFIARSALKSRKRFGGGVLEPTHFIEAQIKLAAQKERMGTLEEANLIDGFEGIRNSYDKLTTALYMMNAIAQVSQEGEVHAGDLFDLTGNALNALQALDREDEIKRFRTHFILRFLHLQGVLLKEEWMKPYIQLPMNQGHRIADQRNSANEVFLAERALETYLRTAEVF